MPTLLTSNIFDAYSLSTLLPLALNNDRSLISPFLIHVVKYAKSYCIVPLTIQCFRNQIAIFMQLFRKKIKTQFASKVSWPLGWAVFPTTTKTRQVGQTRYEICTGDTLKTAPGRWFL